MEAEPVPRIQYLGVTQEHEESLVEVFVSIFCETCHQELSLMGMNASLDGVSMLLFCDNDACQRSKLRYRFNLSMPA